MGTILTGLCAHGLVTQMRAAVANHDFQSRLGVADAPLGTSGEVVIGVDETVTRWRASCGAGARPSPPAGVATTVFVDPAGLQRPQPVPDAASGPGAAVPFDPLRPTIFHEPWWLGAATDGCYAEAIVARGGKTIGCMPYVISRLPLGSRMCGMAPLTHVLGPGIDPGQGLAANRRLRADGIVKDLLAALPPCDGFYFKMHRGVTDTLLFQDIGYRTSVQFTHEVAPAPAETLWREMRDKTRNAIRAAEARHRVTDMPDPEWFARFYGANLAARGARNHYGHIGPVCAAAIGRGRGRIVVALDETGRMSAAVFYAWDARCAYYLLSTRTPAAGNGATSLLIWHAMQDSAARGLIFDFDGVATQGSRLFYTGFGGTPSPRYIVSRYTLRHRLAGRLSNPFRLPTHDTYQW